MKALVVTSILFLSLLACKEKAGPEYTSKYICPMHCKGSGSDTTGVCPKCGMDYVVNKEHAAH